MQYLRQNTASQEFYLRAFVDDTDFKTAETALSIANTDIKIMKTGATATVNKNSGGATHYANGNYYCVMDATDSNTLGSGSVEVKMAGALLVYEDFTVLSQAVYDAWFGANPQVVNATQVAGSSAAATELANGFSYTAGPCPALGIIDMGTAQAANATTIQFRSAFTAADDSLNGAIVFVRSSTNGIWQRRVINAYAGSTDTATVDTWVQPTGTIQYIIFGAAPSSIANALGVNVLQVTGQTLSGNVGSNLNVLFNNGGNASTKVLADIQTSAQIAALIGSTPTTVGTINTDAISAAAVAAAAVTKIQNGLASQSSVTDIANKLGIPASTVAAQLLAIAAGVNVNAMNGHALKGDGSEGDEIRTENAPY